MYVDPEADKAIGVLVRTWRRNAGMTQAKLAERVGTHRPIIGRVERGVHLPSLITLSCIAQATGGDMRSVGTIVDTMTVRIRCSG